MAKDLWAALASFCRCLFRRCLLSSLSVQASYSMRLCNDVRVSVVNGVTDVLDVCNTSSCGKDLTAILAFVIIYSAGGFGVYRSTFSGLNGNRPFAAHSAVTFLLVNALSLAGLYREVKCSLPTVSKPPRYSRSTSSR